MTLTTRITKSGQITIPAPIRDKLGVQVGDIVRWSVDDNGSVRLCSSPFTLEEMDGILGPLPENASIDEIISHATTTGIQQRQNRSRDPQE